MVCASSNTRAFTGYHAYPGALGLLGWPGAGFAIQGLMLLSIVSGPIVGFLVLWAVRQADLKPHIVRRAIWLGWLAIPVPLLLVLTLFWLARLIYGD